MPSTRCHTSCRSYTSCLRSLSLSLSLSEHEIMQAIEGLSCDRSSIFIAHRLSTVVDCDQIIVLDETGHVVEHGKHYELLAEPGSVYGTSSSSSLSLSLSLPLSPILLFVVICRAHLHPFPGISPAGMWERQQFQQAEHAELLDDADINEDGSAKSL
eukprot:TRINITY_DN3864_c0_g1_i1.p1 TRINITY_DN3864_c0_g1~~TRINITY_DN3864_c0_g1_i1.p1  ORF type:complete len:157 (-),score=29.21 TRINITY_DN3864_c0_g1_i1:23-493(-)